ncbi:MAG: LacI family DNA-binding transcriptional regulator [Eubacteriales bacterium]|nr:LacI family DNA-binding transcriptional regulator [Eubacteriales bacterium]
MITLADIAQRLGMSKSTISRALSEKETRINEKTKALIRKTAYEMGYYDKAIKSVMHVNGNHRPNIGVSVADLSNPFSVSVIKGILDTCSINNYSAVIMDSNGDERNEENNIRNFMSLGVEGMIILAASSNSHKSLLEIDQKSPKVFVGHKYRAGEVNYVAVDTRRAIYQATEYLIQLGHKNIVFIGAQEKFAGRVDGFCSALNDYGIEYSDENIRYCATTRNGGYNETRSIMKNENHWTAIVCVNDIVALGVMEYIKQHGKNIPQDFSITGLDNLDITDQVGIELTTVGQPSYEIGKQATEILIDKIRRKDFSNNESRMLEYYFVIRKSCRDINKGKDNN